MTAMHGNKAPIQMYSSDLSREIESYLGFLIDHELEETYADAPLNRTLAENKSPNPRNATTGPHIHVTPAPGAAASAGRGAAASPDRGAWLHEARQRAGAARSVDELYAELEAFQPMPMRHEGGRNLVRFRGSATPDIFVVGECPDEDEDETGQAFAGKTGALVDAALAAAGLKERALMTPCAFWRPAGGRPLTAEDVELTAPFMHALIRLTAPKALLLLGSGAVSVVLNLDQPLSQLRGRVVRYRGEPQAPAAATYPAKLLLRQPQAKALFWRDLLQLTVQAGLQPSR